MVNFKLFILTSVFFFCCCPMWAQTKLKNDSTYFKKDLPKQESRSSLVFSGSFMHFQGKLNDNATSYATETMGYYSYPINSSLGIYYQYQILKKSYILSGINYQVCHIASTEYAIRRFRYREPSISVYLKHYFLKNERIGLFSSIGLSFGQMKLLANESHGHNYEWGDLDTKYLQNYSNDKSFIDVVLTTGILSPSLNIDIAPFIGYRLKDNWMGYYRHRFFYGISINYQLKFSKK